MSHFTDLAAAISQVNVHFGAIREAVKDEPRAHSLQQHLAAQILKDLRPILEQLQLKSWISGKFGSAAKDVLELQAECREFTEL